MDNGSYISFDGTSVRDQIVTILNKGGIYTDQNYQGSNLSSLIDVISYSFSTLLYYLNKTSSESLFSEAQIYENMNRIVKLLNYSPVGKTTQTVPFTISYNSAQTNSAGYNIDYLLPRYSYIRVGGNIFSTSRDIVFNTYQIQNPNSDLFLYQGIFQEYPLHAAMGVDNEVIHVNLGDSVYLDHYNIFVYVKPLGSDTWEEWKETENLFLNIATESVFEKRFNPNKNYEIKFGDDINGKKLNAGDQVQIYYLSIDPTSQTIAANALSGASVNLFNSINYQTIIENVLTSAEYNILLDNNTISNVIVNNDYPSNPYSDEENVDDIRKNAPKNFSYQQRLVTTNDFYTFINNNYKNIVSDVSVVNNDDYLRGHLKYLYNIGLNSPQLDGRVLYNQIKFSSSCNFNNVYSYLVPSNANQQYLNAAQKETVSFEIQKTKVLTSEFVILDPIYMYLDFYIQSPNSEPTITDLQNTKLLIYKSSNTRKTTSGIIAQVSKIITDTFDRKNAKLGQYLDINELTTKILSIDGVDSIKTYRSDTNTYVEGISLLLWNQIYPKFDINVYTQNVQLQYFQYPVFNSISNLTNRIQVIEPTNMIQITDF